MSDSEQYPTRPGIVTRRGNADKHPGLQLGVKQKRRTPAEMKEAREAQAREKKEADKKRAAAVKSVAALENLARGKSEQSNLNRNHPKDTLTVPRSVRKRQQSEGSSGLQNEEEAGEIDQVNEKAESIVEETTSMEIEGGDESSSEFMPEDEDEEDNDGDMDVDPDEPTTAQVTAGQKSAGTKIKKGVLARDEINKAAGLDRAFATKTPDTNKRKAEGPSSRTSKKSKPGQPVGIIASWQKPTCAPKSFHTQQSTPSAPSTEIEERFDSDDAPPAFRYGGLLSDDEGIEVLNPNPNTRHRSVVKIEEVHAAPRTNSHRIQKKNKRYNNQDLPYGTLSQFTKFVVPLACDAAGTLSPWTVLSTKEIVIVWNLVFGDQHPIVAKENGESSLLEAVKFLVRRAISNWIHRFSDAAVAALEAEYETQGLETHEDKAEFVKGLLGSIDDMQSKDRPFLWESVYDEPGKSPKEGLFQGRLVARTLLEHFNFVAAIPEDIRAEQRPTGALIYSVQAVHRALLYSITGRYNPPGTRNENAFSGTNWGDYQKEIINPKTGSRKPVMVKRASLFVGEMERLKDEQWDHILEAAYATQPDNVRSIKTDDEPVQFEDSADDELVDPRYA